MIRTCKQLENKLNTINNTTDIKIKKDGSMYIVVMGGYESDIWGYGLKDPVSYTHLYSDIRIGRKILEKQYISNLHQ